MHIPASALNGSVCPITLFIGMMGAGWAGMAALRQQAKPGMARFLFVIAVTILLQAFDYPVLGGTTGHYVGATLAAAILGLPLGILAMVSVVSIQALVLHDGDIVALGANTITLAYVGATVGHIFFRGLVHLKAKRPWALAIAAWTSVMAAAVSTSAMMAVGGSASFFSTLKTMGLTHSWVGLGEAFYTTALYYLVLARRSSPLRQTNLERGTH